MATPLPYCTLSEVQAEIRNYDANINDKLISAIERATAYIDEYCRKTYQPVDRVSVPFRVPSPCVAGKSILLPFPVRELLSIEDGDQHGEALTPQTVEWHSGSTRITAPRNLVNPVNIYGTFGGESSNNAQEPPLDLPAGIRRAAVLIAAAFSGEYNRERIDINGERQNVLETWIPKEARELLNRYARTPASYI